ncbi:MAG: hypothetical protein K6A44_04480 [bacterium]|nr:hypothetical protein [bacterium]
MAKRVKISTKTTRNKEFNRYTTGDGTSANPYVVNSVTSMTATQINRNINLLDVNDAIVKKGGTIADDAYNNTTLIEALYSLDEKLSKKLRDFAINGRPDPAVDPKGAIEYDLYEQQLEANGSSYKKLATMVINYKDGVAMNTDAGINFDKDADYYIFGAPEQVILNNRQHYNNCGIESTLNNLAMAGLIKMKSDLSDQEKTEQNFLKNVWIRNLANDSNEIGTLEEADGGTTPDDYRDIMEYYGIESTSYYITTKSNDFVYPKAQINELAYKISQGYGAVLGVSSSVLWNGAQSETEMDKKQIDHAISITGVVYDTTNINPADNGGVYVAPVGFYIHDTGAWMTRFISYDDFIKSTLCDYVYGDMDTDTTLTKLKEFDSRLNEYIKKEEQGIFITLTNAPIKDNTFNLNATGDKYANILWGNNSNNIIKGMNGNDTLYGRAGNDTIYGGNGNDTIVGAEAYTLKVKDDDEAIIYDCNTISDFKNYIENADIKAKLDKIQLTDYGTLTVDEFIDLADIISKGINTIYGDAGVDIIIGGEQADLIYGGKNGDYIWGGYGRNAIYGESGADVIIGGYDNDRLFGGSGNDYIFGLGDDDVISGGSGNDHIWGGTGCDTIETGKGNDTIYFEGRDYNQDIVTSKGGTTVFKFIDGQKGDSNSAASEMFFTLKKDDQNNKVMNLSMAYTKGKVNDDECKISFNDFYNVKSNKTKSLYLDAADGIYNVSVSNKAKATVANTKMTNKTVKINGEKIKNSDINNVLISIYEKGATITTSKKNDIVTMAAGDETINAKAIDKIKYTGGIDKYVSEDRDTYYTTGEITYETNLSIYDNNQALKKAIFNQAEWEAAGKPIATIADYYETIDKYVSTDDRLYLGSEKSAVNYLFDVGLDANYDAITTANTGLYLTNGTNFDDIVKGDANGGFIYMDSFLKYENTAETKISGTNFYGNGQIEGIYYSGSENPDDYTADLTGIASDVANWLSTYNQTHLGGEFNSAFDAFQNGNDTVIAALTNLYTGG